MKYLLLVIVISLQAVVTTSAAAWPADKSYRTQLESLYHCQWLTAGSDEEQEQETKEQDNAGEDDEPDCD